MNSFKQALNHFKGTWKDSLIFGLCATLIVFLVRYIPYVSAFLISFCLLALQEIAQYKVEKNAWPRELFHKKSLPSYLITSLILLPTSVLLGSAIGILQSPQALWMTAPLSLGLLMLAVYFYFVLSHSLRFHLETNESLGKAIDVVGLVSIKSFKNYFVLSFYFALLILLSSLIAGLGLIAVLPLLFYVGHFFYLEIKPLVLLKVQKA
ncbi:hypothetical protein [Bdellovibrio bacteriovorus]|uniref:hypothetical protein n=1 Tax=Bdellovibrio bacteriovorus TaxID=959 RepID=UPI0035A69DE0